MSQAFRDQKRYVLLPNGRRMAFIERGEGRPIVFLHGNPTSSFLWRNVIPEVEHLGRCIAPDLIGMGDSEKIPDPGPDTYTFESHRQHLDAFLLSVVGPDQPLVLVVHDWGSALGFDWARRHSERVRGIAYMEAIVRPIPSLAEWGAGESVFLGFRSPKGEQMILENNMFVERILPGSILRKLSDAEMDEYRRPFLKPEDRWPTLTWPRQIPVGDEPPETVAIARAYSTWLAQSTVPKLFINAVPGAILKGPAEAFCRTWPNQTVVDAAGSHFLQEDSGAEIGKAVAAWAAALT